MKVTPEEFVTHQDIAIRAQERFLFMRSISDAHKSYLRDSATTDQSNEEFQHLLTSVFSPHELSNFLPIARRAIRIDNHEDISRWFHAKYFQPVRLMKGGIEDSVELSGESFRKRLTRATWISSDNNIQFIVGNIGDGKTTYICNTLYNHWTWFLDKKIIPIRINFDTLTNHRVPKRAEAGKIIYDQLIQSLITNQIFSYEVVQELKFRNSITLPSDYDHVFTMLANLIRSVQSELRKTFLIVIDNIDFLYHIGDRGAFSKEMHSDQTRAYESILELVQIFSREDHPCSKLGINVLYCVRYDTLEYMNSRVAEVPSGASFLERCCCLDPKGRDVDATLRVVESRFLLLADIATDILATKKREAFIAEAKRLTERYRELALSSDSDTPAMRLFDHLWHLSRRGLRDVIDQMAKYSWIETRNSDYFELNWRFSGGQYSPAILAYVLGGRRRYEQFSGGVPNLYLINAPSASNEFGVPIEFKHIHFSSMWLKRLILHFLEAKGDEYVSPLNVIEMFCGHNLRAYPEPLVRYLLGVLAQVPQSECIEAQMNGTGAGGGSIYVANIRLTTRGRFLVRSFADSFTYLQLMVDDWRLRLPRDLRDEFEFLTPDYRYLVADAKEYADQVRRVIETKAKQTLMFALLLEEHLKMEELLWPNVFKRLRAAGVFIPPTGHIVGTLKKHISAITTHSPARLKAYDKYCSDEFLTDQRSRVAKSVREMARPHLEFNERVYG